MKISELLNEGGRDRSKDEADLSSAFTKMNSDLKRLKKDLKTTKFEGIEGDFNLKYKNDPHFSFYTAEGTYKGKKLLLYVSGTQGTPDSMVEWVMSNWPDEEKFNLRKKANLNPGGYWRLDGDSGSSVHFDDYDIKSVIDAFNKLKTKVK